MHSTLEIMVRFPIKITSTNITRKVISSNNLEVDQKILFRNKKKMQIH